MRATRGPCVAVKAQRARRILAGLGVLTVLLGCSGSTPSAQDVSDLVRCKLAAVQALPDDPMSINWGDAVDLAERIKACHTPPTTDAGAP